MVCKAGDKRPSCLDVGTIHFGHQCALVFSNLKSSIQNTTITSYPDIELDTIGVYVLELLDDFMLDSFKHGIKVVFKYKLYIHTDI